MLFLFFLHLSNSIYHPQIAKDKFLYRQIIKILTYWNINCSITILLIFLSTFIEWEFGMILYSYNLMIIFINMQEILFQTVFLDIFVHIKEAFSSLLTLPLPHLLPIPIKPFSSLQVYFPHSCIIILF